MRALVTWVSYYYTREGGKGKIGHKIESHKDDAFRGEIEKKIKDYVFSKTQTRVI